MCKEDVRLSRAAIPGDNTTKAGTGTPQLMLKANGERYSLMANLASGVDATSNFACIIAAKTSTGYYPLIGLSGDHPAGTCNLNEVGSIIMEEIYMWFANITTLINVTVGETKWNQPQGQI